MCSVYYIFKIILQFNFMMEPLTEALTKCRNLPHFFYNSVTCHFIFLNFLIISILSIMTVTNYLYCNLIQLMHPFLIYLFYRKKRFWWSKKEVLLCSPRCLKTRSVQFSSDFSFCSFLLSQMLYLFFLELSSTFDLCPKWF